MFENIKIAFAFFLLTLTVKQLSAKALDTLLVTTKDSYKVVPYLQYVEDPRRAMTLGEAVSLFNQGKYKKSDAINTFNAGITTSAFWFKLVIKNTSTNARLMFLGIHERVDTLLLYRQTGNQIIKAAFTGFNYPYNTRPVANRNFVFKIPIPAGNTVTYYLKAQNNANYIYMPFVLKDPGEYMAYETNRYQLLAIYSGIFFLAILFSLFLYFSLKDKLHLWYAFYVFASLVYLMMEDGITYEVVLKNFPRFKWIINEDYWWYGCMLLWLYVMQLFIGQTKTNSRFYWVTKIVMALLGFRLISEAVMSLLSIKPGNLLNVIISEEGDIIFCLGCIMLLAGTIEKVIQSSKQALVYLLAISFGLAGTLNIFFNYTGLTNINLVEPNGMVVGLTIEIIILSFALVERYKYLRKEKDELLFELNKYQLDLTEKIITAQEQERRRLAEDLHDDVGATLGALQLHLSNLSLEIFVNNPYLENYYSKSLSLLTKVSQDIRNISHDLLPKEFSEVGLFETIRTRIADLNNNSSTQFEFVWEGDENRISDICAITLYRIINELINNIIKHAVASEATIQLLVLENNIQIMAEDNGVGMGTLNNKKGIGLINIQSRVSFLKGSVITDSKNKGTTHIINFPISQA
jgi:signal transduction histidine kinase